MNTLLLLVTYKTRPGLREEFINKIYASDILEKIRQEDGCISYSYYFDADDPDTILLVEEWVSEAYQKKHMQTLHMKEFMPVKESYVSATKVRKIQL